MKLRVLVAIVCLASFAVKAQNKVGSINSELIVGLMPETKKALKLLNDYTKRLDSSYGIKVDEYKSRVKEFKKIEKTVSEDFKKIKIDNLAKLERDLQNSQANGNQLIELKRDELMRPLYQKLSKVIDEVAKAEGYSHILTTSGNEFAYIDEKFDITQKVLDKLGIKLPKQ